MVVFHQILRSPEISKTHKGIHVAFVSILIGLKDLDVSNGVCNFNLSSGKIITLYFLLVQKAMFLSVNNSYFLAGRFSTTSTAFNYVKSVKKYKNDKHFFFSSLHDVFQYFIITRTASRFLTQQSHHRHLNSH